MPKERHDLFLADPHVPMVLQVPSHTPAAGRDRQRPDGRDLLPVPHAQTQHRRLAAKTPRTPDQGMQQKARFVDENEVSARPGHPTFDPWPIAFNPASDGLVVPLLGPTLRLLRGKNRGQPSASGWSRRGNGPGSVAQSARRSEDRSTGRWRTRSGWRLSRDIASAPDADTGSGTRAVPVPAWGPGHRVLPRPRPEATVARCAAWCSGAGRSRPGSGPALSTRPPSGVAAPTDSGFRVVSWNPYRHLNE